LFIVSKISVVNEVDDEIRLEGVILYK